MNIDRDRLMRAARQLAVIDDAGLGHHLDREIAETIDAYGGEISQRQNHIRWSLSLGINGVDNFAGRLTKITRAPFSQCRSVAVELLGFDERLRAVLQLLEDMASDIQGRQVQEAVRRLENRRTA